MGNDLMKYLDVTAGAAGFDQARTLPEIIGAVIGTFLSLLGIIFLCLIIYGGYLWMTSRGNEEKVRKAQGVLRDSIIGLIIILAAYSITHFVFSALQGAVA